MRHAIIALVIFTGCAYGGPGPGERGLGHDGGAWRADAGGDRARDAGIFHDAGTTHGDAGHPVADAGPSHADAGATPSGLDAGSITPTDAGRVTASDAGPAEVDASVPAIDAGPIGPGGPGGPGETCVSALDVSAGGSWSVDTCTMRDDVAAMCGVAGTPDLLIKGIAPMTGSTYQVHVGAGWVIQQVYGGGGTSCAPMPFSCGASDWGVSGATLDPYWMWAIERADGSCGTATVAVDRLM